MEEFYRGIRAMGMGNAYTAVADDEESVFYNPAGLALVRKSRVNLINPKVEVSLDDYRSITELTDASSQFDANAISKLFGKNIYAGAQLFPNIVLPGILLGYLYQTEARLLVRNKAFPRFETRYINDKGLVGGFGVEIPGATKKQFLRIGGALKWLSRRGFDQVIPVSELVAANKDYFKSLIKGPSTGFGATLGVQYDLPLSLTDDLIIGSAWQDIGDTDFQSRLGSGPPKIKNNLSAGAGLVHRFSSQRGSQTNVKFSIEGRHLEDSKKDPRLKLHLGSELDLGVISLRAGMNEVSYTLGASVDLWVLRIAAVTYAVENQTLAFMDRERRYAIQLDCSFDLDTKSVRTSREEYRYRHPRD